jgi:solute carrier family 25 phosphate transporter 23/24/25/41
MTDSHCIKGVAPYVGLNFMTYETLKAFVKTNIQPEPTTIQLLACGGIAGTVAQTSKWIISATHIDQFFI